MEDVSSQSISEMYCHSIICLNLCLQHSYASMHLEVASPLFVTKLVSIMLLLIKLRLQSYLHSVVQSLKFVILVLAR